MAIDLRLPKDRHDSNQLRGFQIALICFSAMFLFILFNGWSGLFSQNSAILAIFGAAVLALLAWSLGKYIGMSEGGIAKKAPIFALLLILSAAGVFNWMMIHLEGKTIFLEAVGNAEDLFTQLRINAKANIKNTALAAKESLVKDKTEQFLAEVKNKVNCGFGPFASKRQEELTQALPGLVLPSTPAMGRGAHSQEQCDALAGIYETAIANKWNSTDDAKALSDLRNTLAGINNKVELSSRRLEALRSGANTDGISFILGQGRNELEGLDQDYNKLYQSLASYAPGADLPKHLNLVTLLRLGEWSQIVSVITSRLDQISTWVYLALAVFLDFMLVYLFREYNMLKKRQPRQVVASDLSVKHYGVRD